MGVRRLRIRITGVVQGVGFRPYVYRLARERGLAGFVRNSTAGVEIEIEGAGAEGFPEEIRSAAPPLARIISLEADRIPPQGETAFEIRASRAGGAATRVSPDVAACEACLREMRDPADRRHRYPFINCTDCGPRYSITRGLPYDRPNTTMAPFEMCADCAGEYHDPESRRFHAQPNACPSCGPQVEFAWEGVRERGPEAVAAAIGLLGRGGIIAVKGIGGYHLAADATNDDAVRRLRERKRRSNKAFALMAPDLAAVRRHCLVSPDEARLLLSRERPIVLLVRRPDCPLPAAVAPGLPEIGFMLPYSPLHDLLFSQRRAGAGPGANFDALVMTSGNLSEEPVVKEPAEAEEKLGALADAFLHHDRGIFMRVDDSVLRCRGGRTTFVRRARGYVPAAIELDGPGPAVLACGADLKNTFCLTTADAAVVSQHIGDREHHETLRFFEETLENLTRVYSVQPRAIAHDLHPGYFSTRWALAREGVEQWGVQHHWAHVASVMAEHRLAGPVIGVALDGSGYGTDGTVWGGEFLVADRRGYERAAHFRAVPMPGGEAAARNPWQMAVSYLADALGDRAREAAGPLAARSGYEAVENVLRLRGMRELSPLTSGAGRLFETVAALLGLCDVNTYEGEAAMLLEAAAAGGGPGRYSFDLTGSAPIEVNFSATLGDLVEERDRSGDRRTAAAKFHRTVAAAVVETTDRLHRETGVRDVALSGGVFQNRLLLEGVTAALEARGLRTFSNECVPANDGGVSLGQALLLRERLVTAG